MLQDNLLTPTDFKTEPYCSYCYPDHVNHRQEKLNSFLLSYCNRPLSQLLNIMTLNRPLYFTDRYLVLTIIILQKFNKIKRQPDIQSNQTLTRLQLLWDEAKNRHLEIYSFTMQNRQLLSFLLVYQGRNFYFHYSPTTLLHKHFKQFRDPTYYDHKYQFKKTLRRNNLPTPEGECFFSSTRAFNYGMKLGFPLVVKPAHSTFSHHVMLNIQDTLTLRKAIEIVKIIDCGIIIERFILGDTHRMMVIDDQLIVCSKRTRPSIVGDGQSSISTLIDRFNDNPLRGDLDESGFALFKIQKDPTLQKHLAQQNLHLNHILNQDQKVYLSDKSNCSNGAEVINLTEQVCAENINIFIKLHQTLGIAVSAIDFICKDISQPWTEQSFAFLENNSFPAIDPQHYPSAGQPVNVAKAIWDFVLKTLATRQR